MGSEPLEAQGISLGRTVVVMIVPWLAISSALWRLRRSYTIQSSSFQKTLVDYWRAYDTFQIGTDSLFPSYSSHDSLWLQHRGLQLWLINGFPFISIIVQTHSFMIKVCRFLSPTY